MKLKNYRFPILFLAIIFICIFIGYQVDTCVGTVKVQRVYFPDGKLTISGKLYTPIRATSETKAPAVITAHGQDDGPEFYSALALELARRGYVVLSLECTGQGSSDSVNEKTYKGALGAIPAYDYLTTLKNVDSNAIGAIGHSKGDMAAMGLAQARKGLKAVITQGINDTTGLNMNIGMLYSRLDEGTVTNLPVTNIDGKLVTNFNDIMNAKNFPPSLWDGATTIEFNKPYGNFQKGTGRICYQPTAVIHPLFNIDPEVVKMSIDFFQRSIPSKFAMNPDIQVWQIKYFFVSVAFFSLIAFMLSIGSMLLKTKYFTTLKSKKAEAKGEK